MDRKIVGAITPVEVVELAELQGQMMRYVNRVAPLPIEDARELHRQLLGKARAAPTAGDQPT